MKILDIIQEGPNDPSTWYDKEGNYIPNSYLKSVGMKGISANNPATDKSATGNTKTTNTGSAPDKSPTAKTGPSVPKNATEDQMKRFGESIYTKINWREMRDYIVARGLHFNHAVAMVVNAQFESELMPGRWVHSDNKQGPSGGLFMFHDAGFKGQGFFSSMVAACGGPGKWQTNWKGQIDFALDSPMGHGRQFKAHPPFASAYDATYWYTYNFEVPADRVGGSIARAKVAHQYTK